MIIKPTGRFSIANTNDFAEIEKIHGSDNWCLDTILQETGNCYLYEKLGYKKTGVTEKINDYMDIVYYEKN